MHTRNRPLKVFLCHASIDKPTVRELYHRLDEEGWIDVWLDEMKLLPGQEWDIEIEKAVENADIVLVCLSDNSVDKEGYIQKELRFVLNIAEEKPEGSIFIIPLRLDKCAVPRRLRHWQWMDYFPKNQRKSAYQRILESLKIRAGKLGILFDKSEKQSIVKADESAVKPIETPANQPKQITPVHRQIEENEVEKPARRNSVPKRSLLFIGTVASGILVISFLIWGRSRLFTILPLVTSTTTYTSQPIATFTSQPTPINTPSPTQTSIPPIPTLGVGSTMIGNDGMSLLYVPVGNFVMGSDSGTTSEKPAHSVYLDAFWIDKTEVTNAMYAKCVHDKACNVPRKTISPTHDNYYGNPDFSNYPVIYVSWEDAAEYCTWANRRLPTEAEWEKAARSEDARDYPWGNTSPDENLLNDDGVLGDTTEVGTYPRGASPYGALDMAGNVSEWVADLYRELYYNNQPKSNPLGPAQGSARVVRGGSWVVSICKSLYGNTQYTCGREGSYTFFEYQNSTLGYYEPNNTYEANVIYTWRRKWDAPTVANNYYGFRCAMNAVP